MQTVSTSLATWRLRARIGSGRPDSVVTPAPASFAPAMGREPLSLWTLLYLNALPPPGR